MQRATICLTAVLALTITFFVSTTRAQHTGSAEISIDQLAFFAGHWSGDVVGGVAEEGWFAPSGGTMIGAFRVMQNNVTLFSEFFLIEESDEGIIFRFKHFNNDYTTWCRRLAQTTLPRQRLRLLPPQDHRRWATRGQDREL